MKRRVNFRHQWIVWLYTVAGHAVHGGGVPIQRGTIVSSRKAAKQIAKRHAGQASGNKGVWCRFSHLVRGLHAQSDHGPFFDVTATHVTSDGVAARVLCDMSPQEFVWLMAHPYSRLRYAHAARNRYVKGERRETVFRGTTTWQAGDFIIEVAMGYFWTSEEAASFAKLAMQLKLSDDMLSLLDMTGEPIETQAPCGEWLDWVDDKDVSVFKLKPEVEGKTATVFTDYELVDIPIDEFGAHADLRTFASLSFGVRLVATLHFDLGIPLRDCGLISPPSRRSVLQQTPTRFSITP
jgi:hypothetical protein